jgi:hypothetical protein
MVNRYPVNWLDRGVIEAVDAADYDALAARLAEAEWLLRECRGDLSEWCKSYESPHDTMLLMQHVDAFLRTTDSATPRENARE